MNFNSHHPDSKTRKLFPDHLDHLNNLITPNKYNIIQSIFSVDYGCPLLDHNLLSLVTNRTLSD